MIGFGQLRPPAGIALGRTNPDRDAAREAKRVRRGAVPKGVEFTVSFNGEEWCCYWHHPSSKTVHVETGTTPVSAIIAAEVAALKVPRRVSR